MSILETRNLRKIYGSGDTEVRALDGVNLSVDSGEFVAIVGTSGSGKSTLLHMLGGLDRPTSGSVIVDGKDIFSLKDEALTIFRRRKIGFVFQSYNLVPVLNARENIVLPIQLDGRQVDEDFLDNISWAKTELIIIDEASMMTLEMLAGILHRAPVSSHIVLLGDPNQLLSVGTGNVIPDLLALGIPHVDLEQQYRQNADASALRHNVLEFPRLTSSDQLQWDDSFRMVDANDEDIARIICEEAARRYRMGESVQVLSPTNYSSDCSVDALNKKIQDQVNPLTQETPVWENLHHMDRVLVTQNDYERGIYNGETGILWINELKQCAALLLDTHMTIFDTSKPPVHLKLAYAMTVHKSQGSQYDTIIMPASMAQSKMLSRNLLYTAISRAKKQVILVGNRSAVHVAMQRTLPPRRSKLVAKTNMRLYARRIA